MTHVINFDISRAVTPPVHPGGAEIIDGQTHELLDVIKKKTSQLALKPNSDKTVEINFLAQPSSDLSVCAHPDSEA